MHISGQVDQQPGLEFTAALGQFLDQRVFGALFFAAGLCKFIHFV
jgi:hypothetical protein